MTSDQPDPNRYLRQWFDFFHCDIDELRTVQETQFVCDWAPQPEFRKVLDVCCGMGRHARGLSARGYSVVGVDRDDEAIAAARELNGGPDYIVADVRDYQPDPRNYDVAIVMGQSFGHFDEATNRSILLRLASGVREGGRVVLDVWNPDFFVAHQGERELHTVHGNVRELKRLDGDRLFVQLDYPDGNRERFEWQLFSPKKMEQFVKESGIQVLSACSNFASRKSPSPADPRLQFVLGEDR